jgi:hypothetical protein
MTKYVERLNKCSFCGSVLDEQFLFTCQECLRPVCSDCSEWVRVSEEETDLFEKVVLSDQPGGMIRVCEECINPGLTYRQLLVMEYRDDTIVGARDEELGFKSNKIVESTIEEMQGE